MFQALTEGQHEQRDKVVPPDNNQQHENNGSLNL
jgi:hypothetical protein